MAPESDSSQTLPRQRIPGPTLGAPSATITLSERRIGKRSRTHTCASDSSAISVTKQFEQYKRVKWYALRRGAFASDALKMSVVHFLPSALFCRAEDWDSELAR